MQRLCFSVRGYGTVGRRLEEALARESSSDGVSGRLGTVAQLDALVDEARAQHSDAATAFARLRDSGVVSAPARARAAMALCRHHYNTGDLKQALAAATAAKPLVETAFGARSVEFGFAVWTQGMTEAALGSHQQAAQLLLYCADLLEGVSALASWRARHMAACSLVSIGEFKRAAQELRTVLNAAERLQKASAEDAVVLASAKASVARVELMQGNVNDAQSLLENAVHMLHNTLGRAHPLSHRTFRLWATADVRDWAKSGHEILVEDLKRDIPVTVAAKV